MLSNKTNVLVLVLFYLNEILSSPFIDFYLYDYCYYYHISVFIFVLVLFVEKEEEEEDTKYRCKFLAFFLYLAMPINETDYRTCYKKPVVNGIEKIQMATARHSLLGGLAIRAYGTVYHVGYMNMSARRSTESQVCTKGSTCGQSG